MESFAEIWLDCPNIHENYSKNSNNAKKKFENVKHLIMMFCSISLAYFQFFNQNFFIVELTFKAVPGSKFTTVRPYFHLQQFLSLTWFCPHFLAPNISGCKAFGQLEFGHRALSAYGILSVGILAYGILSILLLAYSSSRSEMYLLI